MMDTTEPVTRLCVCVCGGGGGGGLMYSAHTHTHTHTHTHILLLPSHITFLRDSVLCIYVCVSIVIMRACGRALTLKSDASC